MAYFFKGYGKGDWWTPNYIASFAILFTIAAVVQYAWFPPRSIM
ncbi:MAG TPA: hypothetical protein VNW15_05695 [Rhizomicrobium sp.]|nr:hypothetical protein [Rhizomicrobium sp.]